MTFTPDMIQYTDIMINNTNKKDTMTKNTKVKNKPGSIEEIMAKAAIIDESKTYNELSFRDLGDSIKAFKKLDNDKQQ